MHAVAPCNPVGPYAGEEDMKQQDLLHSSVSKQHFQLQNGVDGVVLFCRAMKKPFLLIVGSAPCLPVTTVLMLAGNLHVRCPSAHCYQKL